MVRSRDDGDLAALRAAGATEVIPEVVEGSLMLASHALALAGVPLHRVLRQVREIRDSRYALLRGYFHGSVDDANERSAEILLRTLPLPANSGWVGKRLGELELSGIGVEVSALRRGRERLRLDDALLLQAGDVIVMRGASEALALAEEMLSEDSALK